MKNKNGGQSLPNGYGETLYSFSSQFWSMLKYVIQSWLGRQYTLFRIVYFGFNDMQFNIQCDSMWKNKSEDHSLPM